MDHPELAGGDFRGNLGAAVLGNSQRISLPPTNQPAIHPSIHPSPPQTGGIRLLFRTTGGITILLQDPLFQ